MAASLAGDRSPTCTATSPVNPYVSPNRNRHRSAHHPYFAASSAVKLEGTAATGVYLLDGDGLPCPSAPGLLLPVAHVVNGRALWSLRSASAAECMMYVEETTSGTVRLTEVGFGSQPPLWAIRYRRPSSPDQPRPAPVTCRIFMFQQQAHNPMERITRT